RSSQTPVAMKVCPVPPAVREDAVELETYFRELCVLRTLSHVNIVAAHHAFWFKQSIYLALAYCSAGAVSDVLEGGTPSSTTRRSYADGASRHAAQTWALRWRCPRPRKSSHRWWTRWRISTPNASSIAI